MTTQPQWQQIGSVGDVNPIDHGGGFIYSDLSGNYPPEIEWIQPAGEDEYGDPIDWLVYRWILDRCTWINEILSDNRYHPNLPAWYAKPESERETRPQDTTYLSNVCKCAGQPERQIIADLCSPNANVRALAYLEIAQYHGFDNFDQYPLTFTDQDELEKRYAERIDRVSATRGLNNTTP